MFRLRLFLILLFGFFEISKSEQLLPPNCCDTYTYITEMDAYYKFHKNAESWYIAKIKCLNENSTLAIPKNYKEASVMRDIFESYPKTDLVNVANWRFLWINLHDLFYEGEFISENGFNIQYYHHRWADNEPNNEAGNEDCVSMNRYTKLNDYNCDYRLAFICRKQTLSHDQQLEATRKSIIDSAYLQEATSQKYFKLHMDPKPWAIARTICHAEGGNLAIIGSKQEEDFLTNMFNDPRVLVSFSEHKNYAYVGFHDFFRQGRYFNVKGVPLLSKGYVRWYQGFPNNTKENERCGAMHNSGGIDAIDCTKNAVFFCEISMN